MASPETPLWTCPFTNELEFACSFTLLWSVFRPVGSPNLKSSEINRAWRSAVTVTRVMTGSLLLLFEEGMVDPARLTFYSSPAIWASSLNYASLCLEVICLLNGLISISLIPLVGLPLNWSTSIWPFNFALRT